jgi:hypothetical protein
VLSGVAGGPARVVGDPPPVAAAAAAAFAATALRSFSVEPVPSGSRDLDFVKPLLTGAEANRSLDSKIFDTLSPCRRGWWCVSGSPCVSSEWDAMRRGQDRTGQDRTGQDRTGQDRTRRGRAGQGRAGQGRAGHGRAGQMRTVWMHWMLSASSLPIESCLILFVFSWMPSFSGTYNVPKYVHTCDMSSSVSTTHTRAQGTRHTAQGTRQGKVGRTVFVMTTSSSADFSIRSGAGPLKRPCVAKAKIFAL